MQTLNKTPETNTDVMHSRETVEELPIPVAEDWNTLVKQAGRMADVIDRHLDFESKLQGRELRPVTLCPEQRVSLISDLSAI